MRDAYYFQPLDFKTGEYCKIQLITLHQGAENWLIYERNTLNLLFERPHHDLNKFGVEIAYNLPILLSSNLKYYEMLHNNEDIFHISPKGLSPVQIEHIITTVKSMLQVVNIVKEDTKLKRHGSYIERKMKSKQREDSKPQSRRPIYWEDLTDRERAEMRRSVKDTEWAERTLEDMHAIFGLRY
jgi:hypothetical protein